jgi:putative salt-induced outer membrane protein YdiY
MGRFILVALLFYSYNSMYYGQIINIEDKRLGIEEDGWKGNVDLNFRFTQNVNSIWQINNRIAVQYKKEKNTHLLLGDMNLVRSNNSDLINFGYIHYRFSHLIQRNPDIQLEGFTQSQYNTVQKIRLRSIAGGGLKFKVLGSDSINLNIGWTFFYEYEEVTTPEYSNVVRNSNFLSFNWKINAAWDFKTILYYQPNIVDFRDYRISNETSISHRFSEHFSIVGNLSFLYDSRPPINVPVNIFNSSISLRYKF